MANRANLRFAALTLGYGSVGVLCGAFLVMIVLNQDFNPLTDYISLLGANGEPYSMAWNLIGFGLPGLLFAAFGWIFGCIIKDKTTGACLILMSIGFAVAAAPTDFESTNSPLSKVHYASICISLAGWCGALARLGRQGPTNDQLRRCSSLAAIATIAPMLALACHLIAEPIAHRMVLAAILIWILCACWVLRGLDIRIA